MSDAPSGKTRPPLRATQALFLERYSYRRRRLADISRLLPLFGVLGLLVPLLWTGADATSVIAGNEVAMPMSRAITYIFALWALLIAAAVLFGFAARHWGEDGHGAASRPD